MRSKRIAKSALHDRDLAIPLEQSGYIIYFCISRLCNLRQIASSLVGAFDKMMYTRLQTTARH